VFQKQFLQGIVFSGGHNNSSISSEAKALLQGFGMQWHHFLIAGSRNQPSPGPYVLLDGSCMNLSDFTVTEMLPFSQPRGE